MGADVAVHDRLAVVSAEEMYVSKFTNFGYVNVYRRIFGSWILVQTLRSTNLNFGDAVDTDGTRIVVGAPG